MAIVPNAVLIMGHSSVRDHTDLGGGEQETDLATLDTNV